MKIWLDDVRPAPVGWVHCFWPDEVIELLQTNRVTALSLDHDLGNDMKGTGYSVLCWIEAAIVCDDYDPPKMISIHSANSSAKQKMLSAISSIDRLVAKRQE